MVSDVDGTVTKSDVLGHIIPDFISDWSHPNIAELYSNLYGRGYKILYLSSRPVGYADKTRKYISQIRQDKQNGGF